MVQLAKKNLSIWWRTQMKYPPDISLAINAKKKLKYIMKTFQQSQRSGSGEPIQIHWLDYQWRIERISREAQTTAAVVKPQTIGNDKNICLKATIFLHYCKSWTLMAELQQRIKVLEMTCYRTVLAISYKTTSQHSVRHHQINTPIGKSQNYYEEAEVEMV